MKIRFLLQVFFIPYVTLFAQTKAHILSAYTVIDPTYNSFQISPSSEFKEGTPWIYGYAELESWKLEVLREGTKEASLNVNYPGAYHLPYTNCSFKLDLIKKSNQNTIMFRATGNVKVFAGDILIYSSNATKEIQKFVLPLKIGINQVQFDLSTSGEPPCLLIEDGLFSTINSAWRWRPIGEKSWQPVFTFPQTSSGCAPHSSEIQKLTLKAISEKNNCYDFGQELFGYLYIQSSSIPVINAGESETEAADSLNQQWEQTNTIIPIPGGGWRSKVPLAFRYIKILNGINAQVWCDAFFHPVQYRGAFASSDSLLTKIWMNSAYTLRLCMNDFILDGIKRDRLPWAGDLAMSLQANAYTFSDQEIVRKSLVVLGREGIAQKDINGIIDYTLWWIISQDLYQLYYADKAYLTREWPRIKDALEILHKRCDNNGFINPKDSWLFIDWVDGNKYTALQILWWWAQQCGSKMAKRAGDIETEKLLLSNSEKVKQLLLKTAWSESMQAWMDDPFKPDKISRHANILSVVSGLAPQTQYNGIKKVLLGETAGKVATPYMEGFSNIALNRIGDTSIWLTKIKNYWGGMLKEGASSFWEAYDPEIKGKDMYSFYKRPYANSLCHAWSAGPAAFLPAEILGIKPLKDGWTVFSLKPSLGFLKWINITIPTPHGDILANAENNKVTIQIPSGTTLYWRGKYFAGPQIFMDNY